MFGLGSLPSLRALLSRLFHLPNTSTEETDLHLLPRSNNSSGEKSVRGENYNTNTNNNNTTGNATVGIVAKSSQRKNKISKKASAYTTTTNNPAKDFVSEAFDASTHPNTTFDHINNKKTNLRPGVTIINTNNPIIRTEKDSLRVLAEADSAECAVGLRILDAWIDYMYCVSAHNARNTFYQQANFVANRTSRLTGEVISETLRELHAFAIEVRNSTTVSTLIDGARRNINDLDTLAEADAKRAAVRIEELAAAVYDVYVRQCAVITDTQSSSKSKSSSMMEEEVDFVQTENASEKGYDVLYEVFSLDTKLPSPVQWAAQHEEEEEDVPYEKYIQELLAQSVSLLDAALRPWSPNTGGTTVTTSSSVHCTVLHSRGGVVVRYLLAQLKCILARVTQNLEDVAEKGIVLGELTDTPSLRKSNTNYSRILKTVLHRVKIVLFYRQKSNEKGDCSDGVKSEADTLCGLVEALLGEHTIGNTSTNNKKRTAESRLIDIINHLSLECTVGVRH